MTIKIGVIGAGFAGLIMARTLARMNFNVTLIEEHNKVGYPKHCTGLVSKWVVEHIGRPAYESVETWLSKIQLSTYPSQKSIVIKTDNPIARIDRVKLENLLISEISRLGANTLLNCRVNRITLRDKFIIEDCEGKKEFDYLVLAEGLHGKLRQTLGIEHRMTTSLGLNIDYPYPDSIEKTLKITFHGDLPDSLYSWHFPVNKNYVVIGAIGFTGASVKRLISREEEAMGRQIRRSLYGGKVIHGPPLKPQRNPRLLIVGDAAGLNKPLTGGGLYPNTLIAKNFEVMLDKVGLPAAFKESYKMVYSVLERQYRLIRPLLNSRVLSDLVNIVSEKEVFQEIDGVDYDRHDKLLRHLLKYSPKETITIGIKLMAKHPGIFVRVLAGALF